MARAWLGSPTRPCYRDSGAGADQSCPGVSDLAPEHIRSGSCCLSGQVDGAFSSVVIDDLVNWNHRFTANVDGDTVLWLDMLNAHGGVEGPRLFDVLARWLREALSGWCMASTLREMARMTMRR